MIVDDEAERDFVKSPNRAELAATFRIRDAEIIEMSNEPDRRNRASAEEKMHMTTLKYKEHTAYC